jgi:hypothetical protein
MKVGALEGKRKENRETGSKGNNIGRDLRAIVGDTKIVVCIYQTGNIQPSLQGYHDKHHFITLVEIQIYSVPIPGRFIL